MSSDQAPATAGASASGGTGQCIVLHPNLPARQGGNGRDAGSELAEAEGLATAIGLSVAHSEVVPVPKVRPATLFGAGTVSRLAGVIGAADAEAKIAVVIVDAQLTPVQQRNLEKAWACKVIDRTGVILEIFGERARTAEGRLQVELASLSYQRSRLVRSWTHLERQRGGFGFMGGPGESQIETDRRLIGDRIARLKRELQEVKRTRGLHRQARRRVPFPVVALVGYTNAGKSTLFNRLTDARVEVRDQLFATLDPTMRRLDLPSGQTVILSDTVGFISNLPHELVEAFHATLEEVTEADIIVHVRDIAHPESELQKADVMSVLAEMGLGEEVEARLIEVLNKIDLLTEDACRERVNKAQRSNIPVVALSAKTGANRAALVAQLENRLTEAMSVLDVSLAHREGRTLAWLYEHGHILDRSDDADRVRLRVRLSPVVVAPQPRAWRLHRHDVAEAHSEQAPVGDTGYTYREVVGIVVGFDQNPPFRLVRIPSAEGVIADFRQFEHQRPDDVPLLFGHEQAYVLALQHRKCLLLVDQGKCVCSEEVERVSLVGELQVATGLFRLSKA